jgi:hypothetical protein
VKEMKEKNKSICMAGVLITAILLSVVGISGCITDGNSIEKTNTGVFLGYYYDESYKPVLTLENNSGVFHIYNVSINEGDLYYLMSFIGKSIVIKYLEESNGKNRYLEAYLNTARGIERTKTGTLKNIVYSPGGCDISEQLSFAFEDGSSLSCLSSVEIYLQEVYALAEFDAGKEVIIVYINDSYNSLISYDVSEG